jgi:hypothetical protein
MGKLIMKPHFQSILFLSSVLLIASCGSQPKPTLPQIESDSIIYNFETNTISWNAVENAINYSVNIVSFPTNTFVTSQTNYFYPASSSFQVRIKANATPSFSESNYSSAIDIIFLSEPSNLRVNDGVLTWDLVQYATSYEVVEVISGNSQIVNGNTFDEINSGVQLDYKVRAIGNNTRIKTSPYSSSLSFTLLDSPQNLDYSKENNLITWSPVTGAQGYKVVINDEENIQSSSNTTYSFVPTSSNYQVKVIALSQNANVLNSKASTINFFKLPSISLNTFQIVDKANNETYISFNQVLPNTTIPISYEIQVNGIELQGAQAIDNKIEVGYNFSDGDSTITVTSIAPISPITSNGVKTFYFNSDVATFKTNKLSAPTNLRIENGLFTWDPVSNASTYSISFSSGTGFSTIGTSYSFDNRPAEGGLFTAKIRAIGNQGSFVSSNFSPDLSFRVLPKILTASFSFENDILQWSSVSGATSYAIYINDQEPLSSNTNSINLQSSSANNFRIQIKALGNNSINLLDSTLSDAYLISRLNQPLNFQLGVNGVLTWNSVDNARRYVINLNNEILYSDIPSYDLTNKIGPGEQFIVYIYAEAFQTGSTPRLNSNPTETISGRRLLTPSNIRIDSANRSIIRWDPVPNANAYQVSLNGVTTTINATNEPSFSPNLNVSNPVNNFSVRALANTQSISSDLFINSPNSSSFQFESKKLSTPSQPTIRKSVVDDQSFLEISYNAVANASSYLVNIGGIANPTTETNYLYSYPNAGTYDIFVTALGSGVEFVNSSNSSTRTIKILSQTTLSRSSSGSNWILRWTAIPDAAGYRVFKKTINNSTGEETNTITNLSNVFTQADVIVASGFSYQYQIIVLGDGVNTFDSAISNTIIIS